MRGKRIHTRVFGVELMFGFLDWEQTRHLPGRSEKRKKDQPAAVTAPTGAGWRQNAPF
jgi:hypothetical protein